MPTTISRYNRLKAVDYAHRYALAPNPAYKYFSLENAGGDCTNFISQCLYAGGINMTSTWWYKIKNSRWPSWSISWSVANSLFWYLKTNASHKNNSAKGYELSDPSDLELGDVIFYENIKKIVFHSTIVTAYNGSKPLISQHTYEAIDIPYEKPWLNAKAHFIKIVY